MYQAFRVLRPFRWRGWHYGPANRHVAQEVNQETGEPVACDCLHYAGHVFIIEEGHPRKAWTLEQRKVTMDLGLRPSKYATDDEWVEAVDGLKMLTQPPPDSAHRFTPVGRRKVKVTA